VLGANVHAGRHKEIGWFPVFKSEDAERSNIFRGFPPEIEVFHWHGDTFNLPSGCIRIAESTVCQNQAFIYDERVVGLQFHLEVTKRGAEQLIHNCRQEIVEAPFIQTAEEILSTDDRFIKVNGKMERLLDMLSPGGTE
jgi:GMP synthase (glutamine-hydrolysing)